MAEAVLAAGLYPNLMYRSKGTANFTTKEKFKVKLSSSTVLVYSPKKSNDQYGLDWVCFHDMMQSDRVRVAQVATKVSAFAMALLVGHHAIVDDSTHTISDSTHTISPEPATNKVINIYNSPWFKSMTWHRMGQVLVVIDDWIVLSMDGQEAEMVLALRQRFHEAFLRHLHHDQSAADHDLHLVTAAMHWIGGESATDS
ncbi:hypothetical protein DYB28_012728 [Aphanomyces astaci]|uniref:DEAD-box helicase OB fold domain-containing protein n=1 Tax=Aphanomyces astaci TaxID=112090 RepID=A0A9X8DTK9_APHAT|nr:hypothetical protein DYB28_012728 [Aphanomyces astaci]